MEITSCTIGKREQALLVGDYNAYRSQLSRQLLALRRRLGRTTPKNAKFQKKTPVTAEDIGKNHGYARMLLLSAEREWAAAMHMKSTQSEDNTGHDVSGATRSHVISKMFKAARYANELAELLEDQSASGSSETDLLEIKAYHASLLGAAGFEKQSEGHKTRDELAKKERWNTCLQQYAISRVVYAALQSRTNKDVFRDFLNNTVDPTIRYAAYQARLSRTIAVSSVAIRHFPKEDTKLVERIKNVDPSAFEEQPVVASNKPTTTAATGEIPSHITWRGRKANIVDAAIGQALAQVSAAEERLTEFLKSRPNASAKEKSAAYDDVLIASQDAADATRRATEELEKEGAEEGDSRMQDLRVSSLAVNYDLISWRVGRNRVLIGANDGRIFSEVKAKKPKRPRKDGSEWPEKSEPRAKKLARLRERVVLYDASLQSIDAIKDLRGAMRDSGFVKELDAKRAYFHALKCLNIAISHTLLSNPLNALALFSRAHDLAIQSKDSMPQSDRDSSLPPTLAIHSNDAAALASKLESQVHRYRAIADLDKFHSNAAIAAQKNMSSAAPLVQRLDDYPTPGTNVDLKNLVAYPPKIEPVPVKPLFFDVAWNYIDYPGRAKRIVGEAISDGVEEDDEEEDKRQVKEEPKKRGWFGFGR